ncbi:DUF523 and DUF1722 domain-containing protein [Methanosarcina sp. KYL-1]|uniref:YbgA family protein n=1 Tax=Methanosarcina sp. KYL-1 TaxID=2602068 RepID=UPI0021019B02|nr:DUF523 and DUF1722 domain-containing protein [Methanosarcina sp. KYL-1]MCQ1534328.1 DUF523 and DUF1722 domain-containing protein [Methanosarcina sp. KYL-1]
MREFVRPKVVVSKCLEFDHCRYNGDMISSPIVAKLKNYVDFLPVCAEVEIGLGVPRNPIRIVLDNGAYRLVQPASGRDVTQDMKTFSSSFLDSLENVEGFILKSRSPSCGLKEVRVYPSSGKSGAVEKTAGFFGGAVLGMYPFLPVEDEGRLRNTRIKDHFLTRLFMLASFRKVKNEGSMKDLVAFHTENKFLLMAYNQTELRELGKIVGNREHKSFKELVPDYQGHLHNALSRAPRYTSNVNVLMHALGHFSEDLSSREKSFFFDWIQRYREGKVSLCPAINTIRSWIVRFEDEYLMSQTFFEPYPEGMMEVDPIHSHIREDLWK